MAPKNGAPAQYNQYRTDGTLTHSYSGQVIDASGTNPRAVYYDPAGANAGWHTASAVWVEVGGLIPSGANEVIQEIATA